MLDAEPNRSQWVLDLMSNLARHFAPREHSRRLGHVGEIVHREDRSPWRLARWAPGRLMPIAQT